MEHSDGIEGSLSRTDQTVRDANINILLNLAIIQSLNVRRWVSKSTYSADKTIPNPVEEIVSLMMNSPSRNK